MIPGILGIFAAELNLDHFLPYNPIASRAAVVEAARQDQGQGNAAASTPVERFSENSEQSSQSTPH